MFIIRCYFPDFICYLADVPTPYNGVPHVLVYSEGDDVG